MTKFGSQVSRRLLLRGTALAALGGIGIGLLPLDADAKPTMTQHQAHYQNSPKDGKQCSGCRHFVAPHSCDLVKGDINPNGWCMMYSPKG